jgi:glycosyltransferase involved in cell wall biosynthesis
MRVLYDGFIYKIQAAGGINRYLANIIGRLPADWTPVLTAQETRQLAFPNHPRLELKPFPLPYFRPKRVSEWCAERFFASLESQRDLSLIHSVFHFSLTGNRPVWRRAPVLLTIHDMIAEIFSEDLDPHGIEATVKRQAVEAADALICISENTRKDFLERIRFPEDRIFVIPLASELTGEMAMGNEPVPEHPFFLFVGSRAIYKNFLRLLIAFAQVAEKWPDVELCIVGGPFDATERGLLDALKIRNRVRNLGRLPDEHLAKLYRHSVALVYPSLYEGFGIPPLEAMACGTVAIVSNASSLPEVTGDAAILIDPKSVDEMIEAMLRVRDFGKSQRQELIDKGVAWASRFSWEETVRRTMEVYRVIAC